MRKNKISIYLLSIILVFILLLDFNPAFAQQSIRIDEVIPNQASPGQEIRLELHGGGFANLERLIGVRISGVDLEFWDYARLSDQHIEVTVFIPEHTPLGETEIRFIFEQIPLDAFFIVTQPERRETEPPAINQITPQEGRVDSDIRLSLRGNFLYELGELVGVNIAGMDIPFWDYQVASDQSATVWIYLPLELPAERTGITLFYGNYAYEDRFTVTEMTDVTPPGNGFSTIFIIFIAIAVVIAVVVVVRIARGRKPPEKDPDEKPDRPEPKIEFKVEVDPGRQSVESTHPSHDMALDIEFKIDIDPGVQSIEAKETPLIDDDATLLSR